MVLPAFRALCGAARPPTQITLKALALMRWMDGFGPCIFFQLPSFADLTVKTPEQEAVLRSIRKLIEFWRITPDELEFDAPMPAPVVEQAPPPPVHRYRHPLSGATWNGQGSQPPWLREALTREGYTVEELRLKPSEDADSGH